MTATIDQLKQPVIADQVCEEMREYNALTKELGIANPKARLEELKAFLAENGVCVYPLPTVDVYLQQKAAREGIRELVWCWKPLRQKDRRAARQFLTLADYVLGSWDPAGPPLPTTLMFRGRPITMDKARAMGMAWAASSPHGLFSESVYAHAIPLAVLMTMKKIADVFPEAQFFASDYEVPHPDPFLAVMLPGTPDLFVIERWDEPGFRM